MRSACGPVSRLALFGLLSFAAVSISYAGPIRDRLVGWQTAIEQGDGVEGETAARSGLALPEGVTQLRDLSYGSDSLQKMDVYLPAHPQGAPVLLMAHGGAWRIGDKAMRGVVQNKAAHWVRQGFIFVSINYRLLPATGPLQQADDVAHALAFAQSHATDWGGNPAKFILIGHSAGAHLSALLGAAPAQAFALGARPWLGTIALDSAALDIEQIMAARHPRLYDAAFGYDRAYWRQASPAQRLSNSTTPMLLVCSTQRRDSCPQARDLSGKALSMGLQVHVLEQDLSHRQVNEQLGLPGAYTDAVDAFIGGLVKQVKAAPAN